MAKTPDGFVSLKALKQETLSSRDTLELLKNLESEEEREKATVYMHGLAELRKEWGPKKKAQSRKGQKSR